MTSSPSSSRLGRVLSVRSVQSVRRRLAAFGSLAALFVVPSILGACGTSHDPNGGALNGPPVHRITGQTDFISSTPGGGRGGRSGGAMGASDSAGTPPTAPGGSKSASGSTRKVEETDLYRYDASTDRLYYLNSYRGLMIFDVADVDHPKLLGRSPIYGSPVEMIVRGGIASVVVADWYGTTEGGAPFHGSIVRGIDATDPTNIKITGEARLGGWVRDTRVVGDVIYAVSEDYDWSYGMWEYGGYYGGGVSDGAVPAGKTGGAPGGIGGSTGPKLVVSSIDIKGGGVRNAGWKEFPGWGGIFNVTSSAIMLAHAETDSSKGYPEPTGKTELQYIDISDPGGKIALRGKILVDGNIQGWGADNGRWNLDFADDTYAHTIGCSGGSYCGSGSGYVMATVDFHDPDAPKLASELKIASTGWTPTARFDVGRMYLSPEGGYWGGGSGETPIQVYDLSNPLAPTLAGQASITGQVWLFMPDGNRLFALGSDYVGGPYYTSSKVSLRYLDVTDAKAPKVLGTSTFGDGWAWTPAAGTFKAFVKDDKKGLVVLPFSGWSDKDSTYNNGVQLISFDASSITTAGAAKSHGWVERGIFVKSRVVSLSDMSLSVVDYTDKMAPKVVNEITLARNVVDAQPSGTTIAQLSSDWWGYDKSQSELRVLPTTDAEERKSYTDAEIPSVKIDGVNARVFHNGDLAYVVSNVESKVACPTTPGGPSTPDPKGTCSAWTQEIQVVDLSDHTARLRGKVSLPTIDGGWYGWDWGWYGCYWWDWFDGDSAVQVQGDTLAFRRWIPGSYYGGTYHYEDAKNALFVVDLKDADAPSLASVTITSDATSWWGNMQAVGGKLYTTHYEWLPATDPSKGVVRYYLDQIDLTDRAHPVVGSSINVPGVLVGASQSDPSILYMIDYRWYDDGSPGDEFATVKIDGGKAYLQSEIKLEGWVGKVVTRGSTAIMSSEKYTWRGVDDGPRVQLHQIDLSDPTKPVDHASAPKEGWGWLLGVQGDRAVITSGWGNAGIDIYKLKDGAAPTFDQFVRTRGWWSNSLSRKDDSLFLASGYWGVQEIPLTK